MEQMSYHSDAEILGMLLDTDSSIVSNILEEMGGFSGLVRCSDASLTRRLNGNAGKIRAALEFSRRLARAELVDKNLINRPDLLASYVAQRYFRPDQEIVGAAFLNVHNRLIADSVLYSGTLSRCVVEPRRILKEAIERDASAIVLFHTHPSGDPAPSVDDLGFSRQFAQACEVMGIKYHDFVIVGSGGRWVSLQRRGSFN